MADGLDLVAFLCTRTVRSVVLSSYNIRVIVTDNKSLRMIKVISAFIRFFFVLLDNCP